MAHPLSDMFLNRAEYDRGVNTFSPEGRLFQVEYAIEAIKLGSTAIGIKTNEGIVLAVERRLLSPLLIPDSVEKIFEIDKHICCAVSGLTADARSLVDHARNECQDFYFSHNDNMSVQSVTQSICDLSLRFGESQDEKKAIMSRPFGVALLIAGVDIEGSHLFFADPSGTFIEYEAKALGSGSEVAQGLLQEKYHREMSISQAQKTALIILKQIMEETLNSSNVQLATVTKNDGFRLVSVELISDLLKEIS